MNVRKNKMAQIVSKFSNEELCSAYKEILNCRETGELPSSNCFQKIEKEIKMQCNIHNGCFHFVEQEVLLEIGRRFYNLINRENNHSIGSGKTLWYINWKEHKIEKCTVFSAYYQNYNLSYFFVDFESGKFEKFNADDFEKLFFEEKEMAEQILASK